jgi:hypothetical protein
VVSSLAAIVTMVALRCSHNDASVFDSTIHQSVNDHASNPDLTTSRWNPKKKPPIRSRPFKPGQHFVALGNLLFDGEMQIGKGTSHVAQNRFQALQTGTLAGKWNLLHDVLPDELVSGLVDGFLDEATNNAAVISHSEFVLPPNGF